ncbi:mechanosensitive ion channel family protein [Candidatus Latescibacterota bacterium]
MKEILQVLEPWIISEVIFIGSITAGFILHYLLFKPIEKIAVRTKTPLDNFFIKHCKRPSRWIIILIIVNLVLPLLAISPAFRGFIERILSVLLIFSVSWLLVKLTFVVEEHILSQYKIDVQDNLEARRIYTQTRFLKKVIITIIGIVTLGIVLMTFEAVRQLGTGILASAGIVGIVVGLAAQRSIGTLLAGIQIAFTQPIRIDDVVIVENEWGKIEDVTLTYVVVRIWDLRRLILPITYFLEKPFQNWTRTTSDILGTVYLYADYTVPVEVVRVELNRILDSSPLWDRKVSGLQVTNATDRTMELRALMSASDASKAWDLRCEVREKLIEFIRKNYPGSLPKVRAEVLHETGNEPEGEILPGN